MRIIFALSFESNINPFYDPVEPSLNALLSQVGLLYLSLTAHSADVCARALQTVLELLHFEKKEDKPDCE